MNRVVALKTRKQVTTTYRKTRQLVLVNDTTPWYVRLLWRLLLKFNPTFRVPEAVETFHTAVIDDLDLLDRLRLSHDEVRRITHNKAKHVLIGQSLARELLDDLVARHELSCPVSWPIGGPDGMRWYGLTVHVVPWMDGFVIVPDLKELR